MLSRGRVGSADRGRWRALPPPPPAELDAFLQVARQSFVCVQQAWDQADLQTLALLATEHLLEDLREQLAARGAAPNHTEVIRVDARLLAIEELLEAQWACVEFSGLIREQQHLPPMPFCELWMLARLHQTEPRWRVACVQALS